jgi:homoserine kinase
MPRYRVPGSTSNLGHGFDCLGLALGIYNEVTIEAVDGDSQPGHPGLDRFVGAVAELCTQHWGVSLPSLRASVQGRVPQARGLGSSATIIVAAVAACQDLAGRPRNHDEIIDIGVAIEGHPDNIVAACRGGFTVAATVGGRVRHCATPVRGDLSFVVAVPDHEVLTADARQVLPDQISSDEAIVAWQRTALISTALCQGSTDLLPGCLEDAWHERYRASLNPGLDRAREAAKEAGAYGLILSGSGSCVCAFVPRAAQAAVADAMAAVYQDGPTAEVIPLEADNAGLVRVDQP